MKNEKAERVVALLEAAIDALMRSETAPDSPVNRYTSVPERREMRRQAKRLRKGQLKPADDDPHTELELADIYERTAARDDAIDKARDDFRRAERELAVLTEEDDPAVVGAIKALAISIEQAAIEAGPYSEAALRLGCLQLIGQLGTSWHDQKRRGKEAPRAYIKPQFASDPLARARVEAAAEILIAPPEGEQVWAFPAEDSGTGRGRVVLRIGVRPASWVATFERGNKGPSTVQLMPGDKHFFVSAAGAGYIIEATTRTLVEKIGDDVVSVGFDESRTCFFVNHDDRRLEAFGPFGRRLWKTADIGCGFRGLTLNGDTIAGEAQPSAGAEWSAFFIDLATGEVGWEGGGN